MSRKQTPHAAEFEEKEYEIPLYMELVRSRGQLWTPGQVLEQHTGAEAAVRACSAYWEHVRRRPKPGVVLQGAVLGLPATHPPLAQGGATPSFRANLFIQAKRCTRYTRGPTALRNLKKGVKRPDPKKVIRGFSVYQRWYPGRPPSRHQQKALERLHYRVQKGDARADVCYAAPVFDDRKSLWDAAMRGQILARSTFPRAILLKDHDKWVYTDPGPDGWKCSDPEYVEESRLEARLESLWEGVPVHQRHEDDPVPSLRALAQAVHGAFIASELEDEALSEPSVTVRGLDGTYQGLDRDPVGLMAWILSAVAIHGLLWLVVGAEERESN